MFLQSAVMKKERDIRKKGRKKRMVDWFLLSPIVFLFILPLVFDFFYRGKFYLLSWSLVL